MSNADQNTLLNNGQVQVTVGVDLRHIDVVQVLTTPMPARRGPRFRDENRSDCRCGWRCSASLGRDPGRAAVSQISVFGVSADITPLVVMSVGLLCGSLLGAVTGFGVGLLVDLLRRRRSA